MWLVGRGEAVLRYFIGVLSYQLTKNCDKYGYAYMSSSSEFCLIASLLIYGLYDFSVTFCLHSPNNISVILEAHLAEHFCPTNKLQ